MSSQTDPVVLALTGALPAVVLAGVVLAFPAALFLLARYRRAVERGMAETAQPVTRVATVRTSPQPSERRLGFVLLDAHTAAPALAASAWRAAAVYALAIAAFALVWAVAWLVATRDSAIGPAKFAFLFWLFFWPAVPVASLVAATTRTVRMNLLLAYGAIYALLCAAQLVLSPVFTVGDGVSAWLWLNGPPTVLLYAFLARRIRAVGPIVLAFAVLSMLGSQVAMGVLGFNEATLRAAVRAGTALGLGGEAIFWGTHLLGFAVFAFGAWFVLRWIGARYAAKRTSDEMITIDSLMLMFALVHSVDLVFEHWSWIASGLLAFGAYKLAALLGYRALPSVERPRGLLLLRVFALAGRSERLFDALRRRWLRDGYIAMIAGPDLATSAVEPDEFLRFLSGKVSREFVGGEADLAARIGALDHSPDPDRRFRVAEFFCRADTWQPTMQRLLSASDVVLMDLRSFGRANDGCIFEIGELLRTIELARVVFLVDRATDRAFLEETLEALWSALEPGAPNRRDAQACARFFDVKGPTARELRALLGHLAAAQPRSAGVPAVQ